jgi:ferredoxin
MPDKGALEPQKGQSQISNNAGEEGMGQSAPEQASKAGPWTDRCADLSENSSQSEVPTRTCGRRRRDPTAFGGDPSVTAGFTITVEGAGATSCLEGERVLVALERGQGMGRLRGLPRKLPVGCRRGGCGVCSARVLQGEYWCEPMSHAHISEIDEADGRVLSCCVHPLTDLLLRLEAASVVKVKRPNGH